MDTHQDDNKDLEPKIQPDEILESAQKLQHDDKMDFEHEMQINEIEKAAQEPQDVHQSGPTITEVLTLHCLQFIFAFLNINDLVRSERVCHDWREFVQQYLPFVQNYRIAYCNNSPCKVPDRSLSFRTIKLAMRKGEINKMIRIMGKYFVRVYSDCIDEEGSNALAVHCPHLEYLLLSGTHIKLIFDDETDEESQRRKLTGIFLTNLRMNLKTLGLSFFKPFKVEYLQSAIHRLTGLTRLDLNSISVETLQSVSSLLEQMPLLEHLSLMEYERGREPSIDPPCFDRLSRLRELHLWGNEFVTDSWVEAAATCEELRVFNVGTCFEVRMRAVIALCQRRTELTELVVSKLRVTNADVEACAGYCRNLELLDVSWCTRLTRNVLARLTRPNRRPLVVRLHGTRISENNISYEGLILRVDLTPELYNPLQVRYARSPCNDQGRANLVTEAEYVVLEHAIAIDLPDIHAEDDTPPVVDVGAEGDIRADDAMQADNSTLADDAIRAENDKSVEDAICAEDGIHEEDAVRAEVDMRAENNVPVEAAIDAVHAEDGRRAENEIAEAEDDLGQENAVQVVDERFLPIERLAEDQLPAGNDIRAVDDLGLAVAVPEEEVRRNGILLARQIVPRLFQDDIRQERLLRAIVQAGAELVQENGAEGIDAYAEDDAYLEDDFQAEDYALAEDDDVIFIMNLEPQVNGFHTEDDIYPEDDILVDNEMEMNQRLRVVEIPLHVEDGMFDIDGVVPLENQADVPAQNDNRDRGVQVLNRMFEDYGLNGGNGAVDDRDLFADDVLFARDELRVENHDDDDSDLSL